MLPWSSMQQGVQMREIYLIGLKDEKELEIGLDLKICEVVYSNLGDCRVCPIARHRSSWAGWLGHSSSRAGQATENCEQKVTNNMNPPVGKWNLNQSILSFCKIVRMLRKKTQNCVCFSS